MEIRLRVSGPPQVRIASSIRLVALGAETHVAATYDGLVIRIYRNGVLGSETPINLAPVDIDTKWSHPTGDPEVDLAIGDRIGIVPPDTRHRTFSGLIDEVALFDRALPEQRILAHYQSQFPVRGSFQYAVKFVCGKSTGPVVAPGTYFTAINVHNPTYAAIQLRAKVAVALPGLKAGPVSKFSTAKLGPDEALEIDCPDISKLADAKTDFLKGFVVIQSDVELDVVRCTPPPAGTDRSRRCTPNASQHGVSHLFTRRTASICFDAPP